MIDLDEEARDAVPRLRSYEEVQAAAKRERRADALAGIATVLGCVFVALLIAAAGTGR
jgi:hypothetical protein